MGLAFLKLPLYVMMMIDIFIAIKQTFAFVTGPAKTGHVGTNYTLSHYRSYLSTGTEYFHSVTCTMKPLKCLLSDKNFIAITYWYMKL